MAEFAAHGDLTFRGFQLTRGSSSHGFAAHKAAPTGRFWQMLGETGRIGKFWVERLGINGKIWQIGRAPKVVFIGRKFFQKSVDIFLNMWYNNIQKGGSKMFTSDVIDALKDLNKQFGNDFCIKRIFITWYGILHVEFCNKEYYYDIISLTWKEIVKE